VDYDVDYMNVLQTCLGLSVKVSWRSGVRTMQIGCGVGGE